MLTRRHAVLTAAGAAFAAARPAYAQDMAITTTGGAAQGFMKAVVEAFHAIYRDTYAGMSATFKPSSVAGGMIETAKGNADIAFALPPVELQRGMAGQDPFKEPLKGKLKALMTFVDRLEFYFLADAKWAERHGIKSFADIAAKKPRMNLNLNARGTLYTNVAAEEIFKEYGFKLDDIAAWGGSVVYSASGPQNDNLRDGKIDLMINAGFAPSGALISLARTHELAWIAVDRAKLEAVAKRLDMTLATATVKDHPFIKEDRDTMLARLTMAAGAHVSEDTAYKLVKAAAQNLERVRAIHPALKGFSPQMMIQKSDAIDWHPGALKFYREAGLVK